MGESTGLSTAMMINSMSMIHPTGDTTWTGTPKMVITGTAIMELFTSLTHLLGTTIQDGPGYGPDGVTTMMPGGMITTTGDTTPGQPLMRLENLVTPGSGGELTEMFTSTIITTMESTGLSTAITILYTSMTHPTGDTIQDGPGYGPDGVTTMTPGGMMTTTGDTTPGQPLMRLENSVTPGSGGELMEMFTSTMLMDTLSTAITILYTFMTHLTGDTIQDGTGSGLDIMKDTENATTSSSTPGTAGDIMTLTGTPKTVTTGTITMELSTSGTHPTGDTIQDGLGYQLNMTMTTTGDTTPG